MNIPIERWKKLAGFFLIIGITLVLCLALRAALYYSPSAVTRRNADTIAQALGKYYVDHKSYPQTLEELVPNYINDLSEPRTISTWLYAGNNESFKLGYFYPVDGKYTVCTFSNSSPSWDCPITWPLLYDDELEDVACKFNASSTNGNCPP